MRVESVDELVASAAAGDDEAVDTLYRQYLGALTAFARRQNADDAEGVANLAFLDGLSALPRLRSQTGQAFRAYVFRAARNRVIGERRRQLPEPVPLIDDWDSGDAQTIEEVVAARAGFEALLDTLTPAQRDVMVHRFLGGLTVVETADALGRSPDAVRRLQLRGLGRLRAVAAVALIAALVVAGAVALRSRTTVITDAPADAPGEEGDEQSVPVLEVPDGLDIDPEQGPTSVPEPGPEPTSVPEPGTGPTSVPEPAPVPTSVPIGPDDGGPTSVDENPNSFGAPEVIQNPDGSQSVVGRIVTGDGRWCVGLVDGAVTSNAYVELQACDGSSWQRFTFRPHLDGYVEWVSVHSGWCLHVDSNSLDEGAGILTNVCGGDGFNAQWSFGGASIIARSTSLCATAAAATEGSAVFQGPCGSGLAGPTLTFVAES